MSITKGTTVYTLTIDHRHGTDTRVFWSEMGARDALAAYVRQWWPREFAGADDARYTESEFNALPDGEAISEYFNAVDDEFYTLDDAIIED